MPRRTNRILTEKYINGTEWYNLYSDGWCEQGGDTGIGSTASVKTFYLLKTFSNTNYTILTTDYGTSGAAVTVSHNNITKSTNSFSTQTWTDMGKRWYACGYTSTTIQQYLEMYIN